MREALRSAAMKAASFVCYVVSLVSELVGGWGLFREARSAASILANPPVIVIDGGNGDSEDVGGLFPGEERALLNQAKSAWSVALLAVGIVTGSAGNFLTL